MQYPGQCKSRKIVWWLQIWFTLLTVLDLFPKHHPQSLTPHDFHICSILAKARTAMHCTQQLQNVQWKSSFQNHKQALRATPPAFVLAHALSNKYFTYHKFAFFSFVAVSCKLSKMWHKHQRTALYIPLCHTLHGYTPN